MLRCCICEKLVKFTDCLIFADEIDEWYVCLDCQDSEEVKHMNRIDNDE